MLDPTSRSRFHLDRASKSRHPHRELHLLRVDVQRGDLFLHFERRLPAQV